MDKKAKKKGKNEKLVFIKMKTLWSSENAIRRVKRQVRVGDANNL